MNRPHRPSPASMLHTALLVLALMLPGLSAGAGIVTLNGYQFSDDIVAAPDIKDSAMLSFNRYFSDYVRTVDFNFQTYGYGSFAGYDVIRNYKQQGRVGGVACSVVFEQGYLPTFLVGDNQTLFQFELYSAYYYYARDIDDNIHLLQVGITPINPSIPPMSWSYEDLPAGTTTLIYPDEPEDGQEVFGGHIVDAEGTIGTVSNSALIILFDELPYDYPGPVTEYLLPESGRFALAHDWDGGVNGFSVDRKPPQRSDEDESAWEEWRDEHCFISACMR